MRRFWRYYFIRIVFGLVVLELAYFLWLQHRNHQPVAVKDTANVFQHHFVTIDLVNNDTDIDRADTLKIAHVDNPQHGKTQVLDENSIRYFPNPGFIGVDSFQYAITDSKDDSKKSWIVIRVDKNYKPVANKDIAEVYCKDSKFIDVVSNDNDKENDTLLVSGYSQPKRGKVIKSGNKLIYISNVNGACIDSFRYIINDGLTNSDSTTVTMNVKSKDNQCYPWLSEDIGNTAIAGSFYGANGSLVIKASGSDIWDNADGFRFAYQYVSGDCEMYAKVDKFEAIHEWAKAGIMVRESLSNTSKTAIVCISNKNGTTYHHRIKINEPMQGGPKNPKIKVPYWVKLVRKGNSFEFYISPNGSKWEVIGTIDLPMEKNVFIGFAVSSHNNKEIAKATFSNYKLKSTAAIIQ